MRVNTRCTVPHRTSRLHASPRLDVFEAPLCRWFGSQVTCQVGSLWGTPLKTPMCQAFDLSQDKWITFNCGSDNAPAIYYRDRWRTERFSKLACVQRDFCSSLARPRNCRTSSIVLNSAGDTRICDPFSRTLTRQRAPSRIARVVAALAGFRNATIDD